MSSVTLWLEVVEEVGDGLTRSGASYVTGLRSVFDFLWLVLCWKKEQKIGNLEVSGQVLLILGHLL